MVMTQQHVKKERERVGVCRWSPLWPVSELTRVQLLPLPPTLCSFVSSAAASQPPQRVLHLWRF